MFRICECAVCGTEKLRNQDWLLIVDNRWQDKLKILHWDERLAQEAGVWPVCGADHLQELVVHWMTTGSLDYPFARDAASKNPPRPRGVLEQLHEVDTRNTRELGELAIDRESVRRVLNENPECVAEILHALLRAVDPGASRSTRQDIRQPSDPLLQPM